MLSRDVIERRRDEAVMEIARINGYDTPNTRQMNQALRAKEDLALCDMAVSAHEQRAAGVAEGLAMAKEVMSERIDQLYAIPARPGIDIAANALQGRIDKLTRLTPASVTVRDGWIAVSERLPRTTQSVLCLCQEVGMTDWQGIGYLKNMSVANDWVVNGVHATHHDFFVTHWQPLPNPPAIREQQT